MTNELLKTIDKERVEVLTSTFLEFYTITLDYIDKWYRQEKHPTSITWTSPKERNIGYEEVKELAKQIDPPTAMMDELFDKVSTLNDLLEKIPDDVFNKDDPTAKWMKIFTENQSLTLLHKLISIIFSIPVSNAFVERVFSLVSGQWTKDRNSLNVKTIKCLLQVKVNLNLTCREMHELLSNDKRMLQ